jgi:predicted glycoside hydrolase/deacetylase ChbG (UPF0249 family)
MKSLVLCADDFAAGEGISRGIAELAALGRISATSAMVLSPRWPQDAPLLQDLRGRLDVGLHLDWTSGFARAAGYGMPLNTMMLKALFGGIGQAAAREVVARQLDAFEAQWKAPPDHIDGHQHVQQFAGIREALASLVSQRYGQAKPWLRISRVPAAQADFKSRVITAMGANALQKLAQGARIGCTPSLAGVYDFRGDTARYAALMAHWLQTSPEGGLIMCHPSSQAQADDGPGPARTREFGYLRSDEFLQALTHARVRIARGTGLFTLPQSD